jgi:hypothetical protein
MKTYLTLLAAACVSLALAAPAQAQFYPSYGNVQNFGYNYGSAYGGYGYNPGVNFGVNLNYGYNQGYGYQGYGYNQGYNTYRPGHIDVVPGHVVPHRGHAHYVAPHVDYHIGNRRYEVQQTPYGPVVSPFPHRHR